MYCAFFVFFFKQKTAYEMRISDWSSDVCSSDLFVRIEASGWKGAAGTALRNMPALERFFENVVTRFGAAGQCEITALEVDGKIISAQLGTMVGDTYCSHKIAYDEAYARLSPGHLLMDDLMQRYSDHRAIRLLNLITDVSWQRSE